MPVAPVRRFPQGRFGGLAHGHIAKQHRYLAQGFGPHTGGGNFDLATDRHELLLETHRFARAQHFAIELQPDVGVRRLDLAQTFAHDVFDTSVALVT